MAHARALLTSTPEGTTDYIDADLRDPATILSSATRTLDFSQPVGLFLIGVLGHVPDDDQARSIMRRLLDACFQQYLALADSINVGDAHREAARRYNEGGPVAYHLRRPDQIAGFFDGLDLVEPGLVAVSRWRPEPSPFDGPPVETTLGGVGRKP
jgi:hypothetical protein